MRTIGIIARKECQAYEGCIREIYEFLMNQKKAVYLERRLGELLKLKKFDEFHAGRNKVDLIIVLGGDGTILRLARKLRDFDTSVFGINMGTLGFMSEIPPVAVTRTLRKIFAGDYTLDRRAMLDIAVYEGKKEVGHYQALNEVVISQGTLARLISLRTQVDGRKLTTYSADGLMVATPTGSTAYNLSAGGPVVYPTINAFILTPICPHSFTQKPILIPDNKRIDVFIESDGRRIILTLDGQKSHEVKKSQRIRIQKGHTINFVRLPGESYFGTLRSKLGWGEKGAN